MPIEIHRFLKLKIQNFHFKIFIFNFFFIFAQNINCGYTLELPHNSHNLCFVAKIGIPLYIPVLLYKIWVQGGVLIMDMFS